jgi:predicted nucleic acid-binding protein
MIVVADTSPINYLVLIEQVDILARIYKRVVVPQAVFDELNSPDAPASVRMWLVNRPAWLEIRSVEVATDPSLDYLGRGEREAIALAQSAKAERLIVDEGQARREATRRGIRIIGLLGVLLEASRRRLIHLPSAISRLRETSFYVSEELFDHLLDLDRHRS